MLSEILKKVFNLANIANAITLVFARLFSSLARLQTAASPGYIVKV